MFVEAGETKASEMKAGEMDKAGKAQRFVEKSVHVEWTAVGGCSRWGWEAPICSAGRILTVESQAGSGRPSVTSAIP